jgi:hypothetical protein
MRKVLASIETCVKVGHLAEKFLGIFSGAGKLNKPHKLTMVIAANHLEDPAISPHEGLCCKLCNSEATVTLTLSNRITYGP